MKDDIRGICPIPGLYIATFNGRQFINKFQKAKRQTIRRRHTGRIRHRLHVRSRHICPWWSRRPHSGHHMLGESISLKSDALTTTSTYRRLVPVRRISIYVSTSSSGLSCRIFFIRRRRNRRVDRSYYMRGWMLCRWVRNVRIRLHVSLAVVWP
jgi:hypothetical protein